MSGYTPHLVEVPFGCLSIWDHPQEGSKYVMGVDPAEGKVRDRSGTARKSVTYRDDPADFSAAMVIELETGLHVASWHGLLDVTEFTMAVAGVGLYYNEALVVVEVNSAGVAVLEGLGKTLKYPNLYRSRLFNKVDIDPIGHEYGWRTLESTRKLILSRIMELVNVGRLFTRDAHLIEELRTMEYDENGVPRGRGRNKDDRVMAMAMALQGRYEQLAGTVIPDDRHKTSQHSPDDQAIWSIVKQQQKRRTHAGRVDHLGRGIVRGPRPRPLPRLGRGGF